MGTVFGYINDKLIDTKSVKMVRFDKSLSKYTDLLLSMCEDLDILHNHVFDKPSITELYLNQYYLFLSNDEVIGYTLLNKFNKNNCSIKDFLIRDIYRSKGYGTICLKLIIDHLKSIKAKIVLLNVLETNQPAKKLYFKFNFKPLLYTFENTLTNSFNDNLIYVKDDKNDPNYEYFLELKSMYQQTSDRMFDSYIDQFFAKNGVLVKIVKDQVVAGSCINIWDDGDIDYAFLRCPLAISLNSLDLFLKEAIKNVYFKDCKKYWLIVPVYHKYFNLFKKYGTLKAEQLVLKL